MPLDDVGRAQAARVAPLIAARRPVIIVSSDSSRAVETRQSPSPSSPARR